MNADNYDTWKLQMKAILIKNYLWGAYVSETKPEADEVAKWEGFDEKATADITLSVTTSELGLIMECTTSKEA